MKRNSAARCVLVVVLALVAGACGWNPPASRLTITSTTLPRLVDGELTAQLTTSGARGPVTWSLVDNLGGALAVSTDGVLTIDLDLGGLPAVGAFAVTATTATQNASRLLFTVDPGVDVVSAPVATGAPLATGSAITLQHAGFQTFTLAADGSVSEDTTYSKNRPGPLAKSMDLERRYIVMPTPDGTSMAVRNATTGAVLFPLGGFTAFLSPDGSAVAAINDDIESPDYGTIEVRSVPSGSLIRTITPGEIENGYADVLKWAPDASSFIVQTYDETTPFVVDLAGGADHSLSVSGEGFEPYECFNGGFSGNKFEYVSPTNLVTLCSGSGGDAFVLADISSGAAVDVVTDANVPTGDPDTAASLSLGAVSPTGGYIAFDEVTLGLPFTYVGSRVVTLPSDGSGGATAHTELTPDYTSVFGWS